MGSETRALAPDGIVFLGSMRDVELSGAYSEILAVLQSLGLDCTHWSPLDASDDRPYNANEVTRYLRSKRGLREDVFGVFSKGNVGIRVYQSREVRRKLRISVGIPHRRWEPSDVVFLRRLCVALLERGLELEGASVWQGIGTKGVPKVPIAGAGSQIVVTTEAAVAAGFDDPAVFWNASWEVECFGDRRLCTRAMTAVDRPDLMRHIFDDQWAMARAAKPGTITLFGLSEMTPAEDELLRRHEPTLFPVAYLPDERTFEFSCALMDETRVSPLDVLTVDSLKTYATDNPDAWEELARLNLLDEEMLPYGSVIDALRVVFIDEAVARREKRLLLEAGAEVLYYDEAGELQELED